MPAAERQAAVFLDRDGVLNEDPGYVHRVADLRLLSGVPGAVTELKRRGYLLLVVSNQSGIARGLFDLAAARAFNAALNAALNAAGAPGVDDFYMCPHHPEARVADFRMLCLCRKPGTGLIAAAAQEHQVDLARSYLVGDRPADIDCAVAAGLAPFQVTGPEFPPHPLALAHVPSLLAALPFIRRKA